MKKLQNNFTTPEQSKRLLELGVPADSADCYITSPNLANPNRYGHIWIKSDVDKIDWNARVGSKNFFLPCWSVGRLMEIIAECREEIYTRLLFSRIDDHTNIENLIHYISAEIENGHIDFSKLEE